MAHDDPKDDDWPDLPESLKRKPPQDKPAVGWHFPTEGTGTPHPKPAPRKTKLAPKSKAVAPAGKLPVPPPKSREAVTKFTDPAVGNPPGEADVRRTGKRPRPPASPPPTADNEVMTMPTTTTKTKPAPKGKAPKTARKAKPSTKKAARSSARTGVREPRKGTMTVKILALASRPQGVSREELNKLTEWTGAPWKWNFSNPQGTGYCDRFGYTLKITEGKDKEVRYHVRKK